MTTAAVVTCTLATVLQGLNYFVWARSYLPMTHTLP